MLLLAPEDTAEAGLWSVYKVTKREVWMLQKVGGMVVNAKLKGMDIPEGWLEVQARELAGVLYGRREAQEVPA
jgi:hypothetical protein